MYGVTDVCQKCGVTGNAKYVKIPCIAFNWIKGAPTICEKCIAQSLGLNAEWSDSVRQFIKEPKNG